MRPQTLLMLALVALGCREKQPVDPVLHAESLIREGRTEEALPLLEAASDTSESALVNLATLYLTRDSAQAFAVLERGVAKGWKGAAYVDAALRLASADSAEGVRRLRMLASQGHAQSMHELGSLYVQGHRGVTANLDSGLVWMAKADRAAAAAARQLMQDERQRWPDTLRTRYQAVADSLAQT